MLADVEGNLAKQQVRSARRARSRPQEHTPDCRLQDVGQLLVVERFPRMSETHSATETATHERMGHVEGVWALKEPGLSLVEHAPSEKIEASRTWSRRAA